MKDIEERVTGAIIERFGVDLSGLVLDMTNFATYIDSGNTKAPIAQLNSKTGTRQTEAC